MAAPAPQAPAAASYIPIVTDAMRLVRVLYAPSAVFEEQKEKPTWFGPWLVIAIICVGIAFWQLPYTQRVIEMAIEARGGNAPPVSSSMTHTQAMIGIFVTPIFFLIFALLGAGILYLAVSVVGGKARYKGLLSINVFAQVTIPITLILQGVILRMRGGPSEAITTMADAQPALGLNVLVSADTGRFVTTLLAGIGQLPIWALFITAVGLMRLEGVKKNTAWTAAIASFVVMLLVGAGLAAVFQRG